MTEDAPEIHVRMGELAQARSPTILKATLGSCVGIAFVWRERGVFALAHCMLPSAPDPGMPRGARYLDQAIDSLLRTLHAKPEHHAQIEAHLAGGSNMSRRQTAGSRTPTVGELNNEAVLRLLTAQGIEVHTKDLGGTHARQMRLDCATATVSVACVPAP